MKNIMKKTKISIALSVALLAGSMLGQAQAANLTEDGLGDAAIMQYYSARENWQTFFRVVNTSANAQIVKFRFHEAANSREVLDFTVFMSPQDVWAAWTDQNSTEAGKPGIKTWDTSCILEKPDNNVLPGNGFKSIGGGLIAAEFSSNAFTGDYADGNADTAGRLGEGYLEVIGVAEVNGSGSAGFSTLATNFVSAVSHGSSDSLNRHSPVNCDTARGIYSNASFNDGLAALNVGVLSTTNSLAINAYLINVSKGQGAGYDPMMIANFSDNTFIDGAKLTDSLPNLDSADVVANISQNGGLSTISTTWGLAPSVTQIRGADGANGVGVTTYSANIGSGVGITAGTLAGAAGATVSFDINNDGVCDFNESALETNLPAPNAGTGQYYAINPLGVLRPNRCFTSQSAFPGAVLVAQGGGISATGASRRLQNGQIIATDIQGGVDAISALIMRNSVINEWAAAPNGAGAIKDHFSQWVLTFPTKHYYVDLQNDPNALGDDYSPTLVDPRSNPDANDAFAPFTEEFDVAVGTNAAGQSCENYTLAMWDLEESQSSFTSPNDNYSGPLCNEVNVVNFDSMYNTRGLASAFAVTVPQQIFPTKPDGTRAVKGWAQMNFTSPGATRGLTSNVGGTPTTIFSNVSGTGSGNGHAHFIHAGNVNLTGLPVDGFMLNVFETGDSRNHTTIHSHKYTRNITPNNI